MKYIIYFMMMLYGSLCHAIVCKHIVERSETNTRKVYQIQRDALGYMWFMNHAGISRFDGTKLKHYKLPAEGRTMDYYMGNCRLLTDNGWNMLTAVNMIIFSLMHWPCATTLLSIKKESQSLGWTVISFFLPMCMGIAACFVTSFIYRLLL